MDEPMGPIVGEWIAKIKLAKEHKKKHFGDDAEECRRFFDGPYADWLYGKKDKDRPTGLDLDEEDGIDAPRFQITINKAAEVVQLFGPALYQQNPDRRVKPRRQYQLPQEYFQDPASAMMVQQIAMMGAAERVRDSAIAGLFEAYLNYTPAEMDLARETRLQIDEALITGLGVLWHEVVVHPSGLMVPGSIFDSVDTLLLDPDAKRLEDCQWVARECIHPVWAVEDAYQMPRGSLKGNLESFTMTAGSNTDPTINGERARGQTNDLICYYKVWSKMGIGARLKGMVVNGDDYKGQLDELGQYCYLAVCSSSKWPLNMPKEVWDAADASQVAQSCQWPIPFWLDKGEWPFTELAFHRKPGCLWPIPHLKPALGELRFINWVFSMLTGKIRTACRDTLVILKSLADEVKNTIRHGPDYSIVEIDSLTKNIDEIVKFIQHPPFNQEIYKVLGHVMEMFDKRTGLTDLIYGFTPTQLRSAAEAEVKQQNATIRPDDMARQVEEAASKAARKEMAIARWVLDDKQIASVMGSEAGFVWQTQVMTMPPEQLFHQFDCSVEAGTTKRPNRNLDAQNLNTAMTNLFAPLFQYAQATADVRPVNALISAWAKSIHLDASQFLMMMPPPMPQPAPGDEGAKNEPPPQ